VFTAAKTAAVSAMGKKLPNKKPIFLGGMKDWGLWSWRQYALSERNDLQGEAGYFTKTNNQFLVLKAGIYRLNYWGVILQSNGEANAQVTVNDKVVHGNHKVPFRGYYWDSMRVDFTWHFNKGDRVKLRLNANVRTSHPGTQGTAGNYQRISFEHIGDNSVKLTP
jgi:hypothetical protein